MREYDKSAAVQVAEVSAAAGVILKDEVVLTGATPGTLVGTIIDGAGNTNPGFGILDQALIWHATGMIDVSGDYYESGTLDAVGNHTPLP